MYSYLSVQLMLISLRRSCSVSSARALTVTLNLASIDVVRWFSLRQGATILPGSAAGVGPSCGGFAVLDSGGNALGGGVVSPVVLGLDLDEVRVCVLYFFVRCFAPGASLDRLSDIVSALRGTSLCPSNALP